jgi:hypothetical protein
VTNGLFARVFGSLANPGFAGGGLDAPGLHQRKGRRATVAPRTIYRTGRELVGAFLEETLPKDLFQLSRFGRVDPPWAPPPSGSGPEDYAAAWRQGYDGGPIRGAFRWLGLRGLDAALLDLPKSLRKRGRAPKAPPIHDFEDLPEVEDVIEVVLRHGAAIHDIQELMVGFRSVWTELDRIRPITWAADDLVDLLSQRTQRGRSIDAVPASMVFLWNSSNLPYHSRQLDRAERMLTNALREVMPGTYR